MAINNLHSTLLFEERLHRLILHVKISLVYECLSYNFQVITALHVCKELTANEDLQLTEVCLVTSARELHDDVSVRRHVGGTRQFDSGPDSNSARVLTADGVVAEGRCRDGG